VKRLHGIKPSALKGTRLHAVTNVTGKEHKGARHTQSAFYGVTEQ